MTLKPASRPLAFFCILLFCVIVQAQSPGDMTITLVGTGGPELSPERAGPSTLIETNGLRLLFDVGRGTLDGLYQSRILPQQVTQIFLTHLHSDHIAGLPDLWITPWFLLSRTARLEVWGPIGTAAMIEGMRQMYAHDLENRSNAVFPRDLLDIKVHEIQRGPVYNEAGVTVTAVPVQHADGNPAFAYRVQSPTHSAFLTGDCTYTPEIDAPAKGVDVLISNVAAATSALEATPRLGPILAKLMRPEQAAVMFSKASPRLAVYSHIVKKDLPGTPGDDLILRRTNQAGYHGPLQMGHDHLRIIVGTTIQMNVVGGLLPDLDGPDSRF
jgi:ribonuclease Z